MKIVFSYLGLLFSGIVVFIVVLGALFYFKPPFVKPPSAPQQTSPVAETKKELPPDEFAPFARLLDAKRWNELTKDIKRHQLLSGRENNENVLRGGTDWHINDALQNQEWNVTYRCTLFTDNDPQEALEAITLTKGDDAMTLLHCGTFCSKNGLWVIRTKSHSITQNAEGGLKIESAPGTNTLTREEGEAHLSQCKELLERIASSH